MTVPMRPADEKVDSLPGLAVVVGLLPFSALLGGALVAKLWEWFVSDPFGAPYLSVVQAAGVFILVRFLTSHHVKSGEGGAKAPTWRSVGIAFLTMSGHYALVFAVALLVVQFR